MKLFFTVVFYSFIVTATAQTLINAPFNLKNSSWQNVSKNKSIIAPKNNTGINFIDVPGATNDTRIIQKLKYAIPEIFTVAFNFTVSKVSTTGAALLPFVFTADNKAPSNPDNQPSVQTFQNALGIIFQTPKNQNDNLQIAPYVKIGAEPQVQLYNNYIKIDYKKPYTIFLQRCSLDKANLSVQQDGKLIGSVNFDIPVNIGSLTYVQAANMVQASQYRMCSATADGFFYESKATIDCNNTTTTVKEIEKPIVTLPTNTGIVDYEDIANRFIEKLGPGCCQVQKVQYGEYKDGYITQGAKKYNPLAAADCSDVLSINRSIVFPNRRTILYSDNTNKQNTLDIPDIGIVDFSVFKNKAITHTIQFKYKTRYSQSLSEVFTQFVNNKKVPLLTNNYMYDKPFDDFPLYCISYKNGDSSKYLKISYFGKKRNINSFTVWNSETNTTVNYNVLRDKNKYARFWRFSPLHYYVGLQTPENPNAILNVFAFAGDLITDIIPDGETDGAKKIHFDYTFVKNANSHLTSMRGTNGTDIVFDYDCNYSKPERIIPPPPPPPKEAVPADTIPIAIKPTYEIKQDVPATRQAVMEKLSGKWDAYNELTEMYDCDKDGMYEKINVRPETPGCKSDDLAEYFSNGTWTIIDNVKKCNPKGPDIVNSGNWQLSNDGKTIKLKYALITIMSLFIEKLTDTELILSKTYIEGDSENKGGSCNYKVVYEYRRN
jgi:hypothetical protein